jgi:hypothetical protein
MRVFDKGYVNTTSGYLLDMNPTQLRIGGTQFLTVSYAVVPGTVYHIVGVSTGGTGAIYINGTLVGSGAYQSSLPLAGTAHIGVNNLGAEHFLGTIDEVAVYNYALTPGQVLAHYKAGTGCQANVPTYSQTQTWWGATPYAFHAASDLVNGHPATVSNLGCATSTLSMALTAAGLSSIPIGLSALPQCSSAGTGLQPTNPGTLNCFMVQHGLNEDYSYSQIPADNNNVVFETTTIRRKSSHIPLYRKAIIL